MWDHFNNVHRVEIEKKYPKDKHRTYQQYVAYNNEINQTIVKTHESITKNAIYTLFTEKEYELQQQKWK